MKAFDTQYWLGLGWLTGPIFGKELRVSSRRRRHYTIRSVYIGALAVAMFFVWMQMWRYRRASAFQSGEIAEMGRVITLLVTWSQFILCQIVAGVMLSTAISDEVYNKTLGVLMTTPISGLQIVMGKLLSKLLQCVLLVGVSLPALAMVRVLGGIPWAYVLSGAGITLCMSVFVGSLSLFFSVAQRKAYVVIIQTILALGILFALAPFLTVWFIDEILNIPSRIWLPVLMVSNPYGMLAMATDWLMSPRGINATVVRYWPWHCGLLLAGSGALLFWCAVRVRRVALRQIAGDTDEVKETEVEAKAKPTHVVRRSLFFRNMGNWPVLWKDLRTPVIGAKTRFRRTLYRYLFGVALLLFYAAIGTQGGFDDDDTHAVLSFIYTILATLMITIITATPITSEKEARSWPILLGTVQADWKILVSKALAMVRWSLPMWGLLFGHVLLFTLVGKIHPGGIILLFLVALGITHLMLGTGLYWSARMRKTTTAVVCNLILPVAIWLVIPVIWLIVVETSRLSNNALERYMNWNPFFQVGCTVDACARWSDPLAFHWAQGSMDFIETLWLVFKACCVYSAMGVGFALRALFLFRRRVF